MKHFLFENETNSEKSILLEKTETIAEDVYEKTEAVAKNGIEKADTMTKYCYGKAESVLKDNLVKTQNIAKNAYEKMETVVEDVQENAVNSMLENKVNGSTVGKIVEANGFTQHEIENSNVQENRAQSIKGFVSNFLDKHLSSEVSKETFICSNCSGKDSTKEIIKTMVDKSISTEDVDPKDVMDESEEKTNDEVETKAENSFKFRFQFFTK